jgi:hypothetical protein
LLLQKLTVFRLFAPLSAAMHCCIAGILSQKNTACICRSDCPEKGLEKNWKKTLEKVVNDLTIPG